MSNLDNVSLRHALKRGWEAFRIVQEYGFMLLSVLENEEYPWPIWDSSESPRSDRLRNLFQYDA